MALINGSHQPRDIGSLARRMSWIPPWRHPSGRLSRAARGAGRARTDDGHGRFLALPASVAAVARAMSPPAQRVKKTLSTLPWRRMKRSTRSVLAATPPVEPALLEEKHRAFDTQIRIGPVHRRRGRDLGDPGAGNGRDARRPRRWRRWSSITRVVTPPPTVASRSSPMTAMPEAARIALLMVRYGPELYGSHWSATTRQIERWQRLAEHASSRSCSPTVPTDHDALQVPPRGMRQ